MAGVRRVSDITTVPYNVRVLVFHNTECHAIRSATLSEVLFWDNFDSISYVMPTSRPVPSVTRTVHWCRTVVATVQ